MKVLIVKTSSMGDILHTLPSLKDAMQAIPSIRFDWVTERCFSQIPTWHKGVDRVIPVEIRSWRKSWFSKPTKIERKIFIKSIRAYYYDVIIDVQGLLKSAVLVTRLAYGVKHGMSWKTAREPLSSLFYKYRHCIEKKQHAVERARELFSKSLGYPKPKDEGDYAISQYFTREIIKKGIPYVIFFHATSQNDKHWPEICWRKLIESMRSEEIHIKLLWWTDHELQRAKRLATGFTHVKVLPKLSLTQIAKKIISAQAIVSVDTGLSHLTTALNRPNITLFGPTDPNLVGGYGENQFNIISPSKKMRDITASKVFSILKKILAKSKLNI